MACADHQGARRKVACGKICHVRDPWGGKLLIHSSDPQLLVVYSPLNCIESQTIENGYMHTYKYACKIVHMYVTLIQVLTQLTIRNVEILLKSFKHLNLMTNVFK